MLMRRPQAYAETRPCLLPLPFLFAGMIRVTQITVPGTRRSSKAGRLWAHSVTVTDTVYFCMCQIM